MVAPISVTDPSSTTGRKLSCCARLNRWISSTNSNVPWPVARRARAASKTFFSSATPVKIAEIWTKANVVSCARRRATVVLPEPGGPQKISDPIAFARSIRVSAPSGPSKWSWPATSLRRRGRNLSASGRGASFSKPGGAKQIAHFRPRDDFLWENNRMRLRAAAARANSAPSGSKKVRRAFTIRGLLLTKN